MSNMQRDIFPQLIINWGNLPKQQKPKQTRDIGVLAEDTYIDTNTDLKGVIKHALQYSKQVDILVGFFYFSGFLRLHKNLKDKQVRILVGIDLQKALKDLVTSAIESTPPSESSQEEQYKALKEHIRRLFNTDYFEHPENKKAFDTFLQKLSDGSLEVRKTLDPVHAKVYLFHFSDKQYQKGIVITGSSNLTMSGLENNHEVNVLLKDDRAIDKAKLYFDTLWEYSEPLLNADSVEDFKRFLSKKTWYMYDTTPYKVFLKAIYEYFKTLNPERFKIDPNDYGYKTLSWQMDALWQAVRTLDTHGGVMIGDVVGLGKSVIASLIAKYYSQTSMKHFIPAVICPPVLKAQWKRHLNDFGLPNKYVFSNSITGIREAREGTEKLSPSEFEILFIIDEAHSIRNADSKTYQELYDTVFGHKIVLLTATPYNNRPSEVINLIKLFQIPEDPTVPYHGNLDSLAHRLNKQFNKAKDSHDEQKRKILTQSIKRQLSQIIEPILIRRTRADLQIITRYKKDLEKHSDITIPNVQGPYLLELAELGEIKPLIEQTIDKLLTPIPSDEIKGSTSKKQPGFKGTIYMPTQYISTKHIPEYQNQIEEYFKMQYQGVKRIQLQNAHLIKRLLLLRFESSAFAFIRTLARLIIRHKLLYDFIQKNKAIPINKQINGIDYDTLSQDTGDLNTLENLLSNPENKSNILLIPLYHLQKRFLQDLEEDIKTLTFIYNLWIQTWESDLTVERLTPDIIKNTDEFYKSIAIPVIKDPKLQKLVGLIKEWFANRQKTPGQYGKLVIFSEFTDTVFYIHKALSKILPEYKTLLFNSANRNPKNLEVLKANFDANYRGNLKLTRDNTYEILLSTDVLSEGINLHQANGIINIDIPYNPSRVVQRIGRINRIKGMKYNTIYIYNYFPTYISEQHINIKNIATLKQEIAILLFGTDTPILTQSEINTIAEYQSQRFAKKYKEAFHDFIRQELDEESWDTRYLNIYFNTILPDASLRKELEEMPLRIKLKRRDLPAHLRKLLSNNLNTDLANEQISSEAESSHPDIFITFIKKANNIMFHKSYIIPRIDTSNINPAYSIKLIPLTPNEAFRYLETTRNEKAYYIPDEKLPLTNEIVQRIQKQMEADIYQRHNIRGSRQQAIEMVNTLLQIVQQINNEQYIEYLKKLLTLIADRGIFPRNKFNKIITYKDKVTNQLPADKAISIIKAIQKEFPRPLVDRIYKKIKQQETQETLIIVSELLEL